MLASVFRPKPPSSQKSSSATWLPSFLVSKTEDAKGDRECCRRRRHAAIVDAAKKPTSSAYMAYGVYDGISYRFVDGSLLQRVSTTVGGHKVPFHTASVKLLRQKQDFLIGLGPIQEEVDVACDTMCESCHSSHFSNLSKTRCITLTTRKEKKTAVASSSSSAAAPQTANIIRPIDDDDDATGMVVADTRRRSRTSCA
ncbi:Aste57867_10794 [Aphanomyces stellatus]|uniref:Aste57867_10794 protein n=1 Tax=Aphanomyces stellatus TaxID=120398 RepID=A0A485KRA1_9STRA|nr:hypothetical protein As57867_010754 [Aphanomyces stellatus]VFT87663.1 Aste57867_10794 [Aphanomyces stellatus]